MADTMKKQNVQEFVDAWDKVKKDIRNTFEPILRSCLDWLNKWIK